MDYWERKNYGKEMILDYCGQNAVYECPECGKLSVMRYVFGVGYFQRCESCGKMFTLGDKWPMETRYPILLKVNFRPLNKTGFFKVHPMAAIEKTSTKELVNELKRRNAK